MLVIPDLPLPSSTTTGSGAAAKLSAEAADKARQTIERRVLAELERSVANAEAGMTEGWSRTVRWVLVALVVALGVVIVVSSVTAILAGR